MQPDGKYSHVFTKTPKHITYIKNQTQWQGITLFTDSYINSGIAQQIQSKYKIGWLMESRELHPHFYDTFEHYKDNYDFVLTHDPDLLQRYPGNTKMYPIGGCWIAESNWKLYQKTKLISMIYSGKQSMEGHRLRHTIAQQYQLQEIDYYGHGAGKPIVDKQDGLQDYYFSIIVENTNQPNYFTEKLIDCLVVGTIPIYWGCPNILEFFNVDGFLTFNTVEELEQIIKNISPKEYITRLKAVQQNLELAKQYAVTEDWLYSNIFNTL